VGTTLPGFNEYLTLQNPNSTPTAAHLKYFTDSGATAVKTLTLPANSRTTVEVFRGDMTTNANCTPGGGGNCGVGTGVGGVSTQVTSDLPIVAERPMYMVHDFGSGAVAGAHDVVGVNTLGKLFGFASARVVPGENDYLTIQNPGTATANITATYYTSMGTIVQRFVVAAGSRHTVELFSGTEGCGSFLSCSRFGIVLSSDQPVLVEKPTYSSNPSTYGATDTAGYTPPSGSFSGGTPVLPGGAGRDRLSQADTVMLEGRIPFRESQPPTGF
jgi:hypothetical protein